MGPILVAVVLGGLAWSGWHPADRFTWWLEVAPVLIGLPIVLATSRRFPLTRLSQTLLTLHAVILMVGGRYTYAQVPLGFWMERWFGFARNDYDRIGHLAQGFIPAVVAREVLRRKTALRGGWLAFLVICFALATSASYELIEWGTAMATGTAAQAFLGTQGDVWDTQWDMFMALLGALAAVGLMTRWQERQLIAVNSEQ
jgi:putative membrane protein